MIVKIVDKSIKIPEKYVEAKRGFDKFNMEEDSSYLDKFIIRTLHSYNRFILGSLSMKLTCAMNIKRNLSNYNSYLDLFAGIGLISSIFESEDVNALNDIDSDCHEVLRLNFGEESAFNFDSYDLRNISELNFDLISLDFNNFTFSKFFDLREFFDIVFSMSNKYVILTDSSLFYLKYGKKSFENYNKKFGFNILSTDDYFKEIDKLFFKLFGFGVRAVSYYSEVGMILFEKGYNLDFEITKVDSRNKLTNLISVDYE